MIRKETAKETEISERKRKNEIDRPGMCDGEDEIGRGYHVIETGGSLG